MFKNNFCKYIIWCLVSWGIIDFGQLAYKNIYSQFKNIMKTCKGLTKKQNETSGKKET